MIEERTIKMKISLKGYGENVATFRTSGLVSAGYPAAMAENLTVRSCDDGDVFVGYVLNTNGEYAGVQLSGYIQSRYSGDAPEVGVCCVVADIFGGVRVSDTGRQVIVTDVDTVNKKIGFIL